MRRPRPGVIPTLAAVLQDVKEWRAEYELANAGQSPDYHIAYYFIGPDRQRVEITEDQLKPGGSDPDWPLPGDYEIDALDSENNSLLQEPWHARHLDKETLQRQPDQNQHPVAPLLAEYALRLRNQSAEIIREEEKRRKVLADLEVAEEKVRKLTRENTGLQLAAEQAERAKTIAEAKQKEAEEAYEQLEQEHAELKPVIQQFFDQGFDRLAQFFGVQAAANTAGELGPNTMESGAQARGNDPPPPGADDPVGRLDDLFDAVIYNVEVCKELVDQEILTWDQVRALVWCRKGIDLGPVPRWDEWTQTQNSQSEEQQRAAG